jgi:transposase
MMSNFFHRRVHAYGEPVDMRKGFDGLYALVVESLGRDPLSGDLFLFVSRNRIRAKVLQWDGTGLCVYAKRLEKGRFARLWDVAVDGEVELSASELQLFLEGCEWVGRMPLSPPPIRKENLVLAGAM